MSKQKNWNNWVPSCGIEEAATKLFSEKSLWLRADFLERVASLGFLVQDWFDRDMHRNVNEFGEDLWPWTSFQAQPLDGLIEGERYVRKRKSWTPSANGPTSPFDGTPITAAMEALRGVNIVIQACPGLSRRDKHNSIVLGIAKRLGHRIQDEIDRLEEGMKSSN